VTGVNTATGKITFTSSGTDDYGPSDYIVFPAVKYANLMGNIEWDHSMARGAEKAPGSPSFISGDGKTKTGVFNNTNDNGGYRVTDDFLKNKGDSSLYPGSLYPTVSDLLDQCFEQYDANGGVTTDMRTSLGTLLNDYLRIWTGSPWTGDPATTGILSAPVSISTFLATDNGCNQGDLRNPQPDGSPTQNRKNGVIDVGAYEN
jgi:hypothetical protein